MKKIFLLVFFILSFIGCTYNDTEYPFVDKYYTAQTDDYLHCRYRLYCNRYKKFWLYNTTTGFVDLCTYKIRGNTIIVKDKEEYGGNEVLLLEYHAVSDEIVVTWTDDSHYSELKGVIFSRE